MPNQRQKRRKKNVARQGISLLLSSLARAADPRVSTRQLRKEGLFSDLPRAELRQRAQRFLRRAQRALSQQRRPAARNARPTTRKRASSRKTA